MCLRTTVRKSEQYFRGRNLRELQNLLKLTFANRQKWKISWGVNFREKVGFSSNISKVPRFFNDPSNLPYGA